jgi:predicted aminopeptidase
MRRGTQTATRAYNTAWAETDHPIHERVRHLFIVLLAVIASGACSPLYVIRAGYEQAKILTSREPITDVIADPRTSEEEREKLRLVLEARDFAGEYLRLDVGDSYRSFARLDSDTLVLVVSGAQPDEFRMHTWWFPIVGRMPYKGFFSERQARRELERLERRGLDTHIRPAAAFSTLGWFEDPLYSTLLRADEVALVNTVIHEILHNEIFLSGQGAFNESLANYVGAYGAKAFFCGLEGDEGPRCVRARQMWEDDLLFAEFLGGVLSELDDLYGREDLTREEILERREVVFERTRQAFREELRPRLQVQTFARFELDPLNNATLLSRRLYYQRLDLFDGLHRRLAARGMRTPEIFHAIIDAAREADDPWAGVESLGSDVSHW